MIEPTFPKIHRMVMAFVLVLKESALRIGDVVKLRPEDITSNGEMEITTEKTDEYVWVTLPTSVLDALGTFEQKSPTYYFWTGSGQLETGKKDWSARMLTLFRAAQIEGGLARRSHNFRKTLAVRVTEKGGLEAAMNLLGHKSIKTTQRS
jgi:integrase